MPVNGEILEPFSNGELVKSETLGYWKTHDGVDIKADFGEPVKAMNKGTVTKIWDDPLWGNCMTIDHGNGIVGHYYNLSKEMSVKAVEAALKNDRLVFLTAQKDVYVEEPQEKDLYNIGVVAEIRQTLKTPDNVCLLYTSPSPRDRG